MAWRALGRKAIPATLGKSVAVSCKGSGSVGSKLGPQDSAKALSASVRKFRGCSHSSEFLGMNEDSKISDERWLIRCFHSSPVLLGKHKREASGNDSPKRKSLLGKGKVAKVKGSNSGKWSKTKKDTPPAETPYVPPMLRRAQMSLPDKTVEIFEGMTILELAKRCGETAATIQNIIVNVGDKADSEFDSISIDMAELVAMEVGVNVRRMHSDEGTRVLPRPPVVTVMGHVDHGKTSLLDALRQTSLAANEAGGITQHLGAFVVGMHSGSSITFLDTPGHAAFSAMRARGAAITDVVVLVVAADDGVMPQTLEAISHAKAANVPLVVAINKCDKPDADPERVKIQLASEGLPLEDMGGDIQVVEVSAVTKSGLDKLEEALLLQAELMDLKARIDGPAQAYVVEARLDKGRGPLATAIVKVGTIACGQQVVVGAEWGKIRCIRDMARNSIPQATPAMPVEIEGLKGLPMAGDDIVVVESEERARMLSEGRKKKIEKDRLIRLDEERHREEEERQNEEESRTDAKEKENEEEQKKTNDQAVFKRVEIPVIVKGDVQGTVQAVSDALKSLNSPQVIVKLINAGVGPVSQSDVDMAEACGACIVGFNVRDLPAAIRQSAAQAKIQDIGNFIVEKAPGTLETKVGGEAEVLEIFELKGRSKSRGEDVKIAGCKVVDGRLTRSSTFRLLRSGEVVFEGCCASLKREKQDVDAVGKGNECGLVIKDCHDFQVGDVIQCMVQVMRKPKFISSQSGAVRIEC